MKRLVKNRQFIAGLAASSWLVISLLMTSVPVYANRVCGSSQDNNTPVTTSIDFGCVSKGNPIMDMTFAIIRFLSDGVGLIVVGSLVVAGIQYSSARGDPQASAAAQNRIRSSVGALILFIFSYALLNYVIPAGFLK